MRAKPIIFFLVVGSLAGFLIYREASREGSPGLVNVGQQAPNFTAKDENGQEVRLSDYRGKLVFLNFWATWCPPCVDEMPEMELMNRAFKDRKFQMLAVSVDTDWSKIKKFYDQYHLSLPTLLDPGRRAANIYKVNKFPETFIIDADGYVLKHYVGQQRWASPRILASIESMIPSDETAQRSSAR